MDSSVRYFQRVVGLTYFILVRMAVPLDPLLLVLITGSCCVRCLCLGRGDKLSFTLAGISCVWSDDVEPPPHDHTSSQARMTQRAIR